MRAKDGIGKYGERVAAQFLRSSGLIVLDQNWRCSEGEIDLVAQDGDILVFCEVKTRSSLAYGHPAEAIGHAKAWRIRRLALRWLASQGMSGRDVRFDVIAVLRRARGAAQVRHLRGAF